MAMYLPSRRLMLWARLWKTCAQPARRDRGAAAATTVVAAKAAAATAAAGALTAATVVPATAHCGNWPLGTQRAASAQTEGIREAHAGRAGIPV